MIGTRGPVTVLVIVLTAALGTAQQPPVLPQFPVPVVSIDEAVKLSEGWALLAQGEARKASLQAEALLSQFPRSAGVLALAIESTIADRGAFTSLDVYERWLGNRTLDEPTVLRRIARAVLYEWSRQSTDTTARVEALRALAAEGVPDAIDALNAGANGGGIAERRALVALGQAEAIDKTVTSMLAPDSRRLPEIFWLGESHSLRAVRPLLALLNEQMPADVRAAAADSLGKIGDRQALAPLKALFETDKNETVKVTVAGALLRFGDFSGIALVQALRDNPNSSVRRSAAALLASQPDEGWKQLVRDLMNDPDPKIRLDAARLLQPHDPDAANAALRQLALDPNPAIQELAGLGLSQSTGPVNLPALRMLLRLGSGRVRVAAADRVLAATR